MLHSCMNWTSATSIGPRPAHPSRMRVLSEHREPTDLSRSPLEVSDLLGKNSSPRPGHLFSSYTIHLRLYFSEFAHCFSAARGHAGVHFLKRKPAYSAQFLCSISPFRINTCKSVSKQRTSTSFRMNTYEKPPGGGGASSLPLLPSSLSLLTPCSPEAPFPAQTNPCRRLTKSRSPLTPTPPPPRSPLLSPTSWQTPPRTALPQ